MTIAVLGGAGYIGSHVVRYLQSQGLSLAVFDDFSSGHREVLKDVPITTGKMGDTEQLRAFFKAEQIHAVIHLAGLISVGESVLHPQHYFQNACDTLSLLDTMRQCNIHTLIFSSSCAVYGNPQYLPIDEQHPLNPMSPYGHAKLMIEFMLQDYAKAYGLNYVALRYFNACGSDPDGELGERHLPETHLIPLILDVALGKRDYIEVFGQDYETEDGSCIRDYVHVWDLARAHELALDYLANGGDSLAVNLGTGLGFSVKQVIQAAQKITQTEIPVKFAERRPGDPAKLVSSSKLAQSRLQWQSEYSTLEQIIASAWEFHKKWAN